MKRYTVIVTTGDRSVKLKLPARDVQDALECALRREVDSVKEVTAVYIELKEKEA